ncbi:30S ribosomal protein S17e [Marine Group I thaumarchaeote SCGC AAA799-E16]|uniref:30S ribosomal protein S17e n=4 Tax=Marine Group I TaxID=905826 RepID=A0A081RNK6_9ARCH|nr:30S ribosomal protein S17e [Marine Group I thaumarchaeote SCGC AAA799-N04]KER06287.1 30S ribosomal protein S17e [Marine Group I thaumarchaeote SCGC AAA799-E16]KFM15487.1 30S ribosomal protein S17e [Marine Group I thaumarchaeote SCGC AAA799-D11]KFM16729.1 30S ribosomal protein S17e [Marine Group I thaumarchaeote SCGC RSA3]
MDRIKRLSYQVLDTHKSKFGEDFADNKKVLDQVSIVRSKGLKNEIAGYITNYIKKEIREQKVKQAQAEASKAQEQQAQVKPEPVEETPQTTVAPTTEAAPETEATTETPQTTEEKSE